MKAIDRILDLLPVPLLAAVALVVLLAWLFKEVTPRDYGEVIRDPYFQATIVLICAGTAIYYALFVIFSQARPFAPNERGVLIAKFEGDAANTARIHTIESLKTRLGETSEFDDVKIRPLDKTMDAEDGKSVVQEQNAVGLIAGAYMAPPNPLVHYQLYWRRTGRVARLTADKFPDINNFEDQFVTQIRAVPTAANLNASTVEDQQAQIVALKAENDRLLKQLLAARGSTSTKLPGITTAKMYVLAVGISNYADPLLRLRYGAHDAQEIARALSESAGFESVVTNVLTDGEATRRNVLEELQQLLTSATDDDYFCFYFSGHSAVASDQLYLLPSDAVADRTLLTSLNWQDILTEVLGGRQKQSLFFFDTSPSGSTSERAPNLRSLDLQSGKAIGIMFAATPGQPAFEDDKLGGGIFTHYLVRGIRGAAAGVNGIVTFSQLVDYVSVNVRQATRDTSIPSFFLRGQDPLVVAVASSAR
jgi:hypothetical protein